MVKMIDFAALEKGTVSSEPFRFVVASEVVSKEDAKSVRNDYPDINQSGYLPLSKLSGGPAFDALIDDLQSPKLAESLSSLLGLDLRDKPRMITVRRLSKVGDGRIHNDSASKICTMLIYLNDTWDAEEGGAIRALNGPDDMDDFAVEAPPIDGAVFVFARSERSWHGHPPFEGERYVVQTTFLTSEEELARKENRGGIQMLLKRLNPFSR
ncbi:MAG: 2OG-Fe(II) oxygenase [Pseudomonadota bacterium]